MDIKRIVKIRNELQGFIRKQSYKNFFYVKNNTLYFIENTNIHKFDFYKELCEECGVKLPHEVLLQTTYKQTHHVAFDLSFEEFHEGDISGERYKELHENILKYL